MMGFFSNLFAKQNCAVCGKECGTLHRSKLRDGQFLCDDCGNKCSKYIRLSELTLDEAAQRALELTRQGFGPSAAAKAAAQGTPYSKSEIYKQLLVLQQN